MTAVASEFRAFPGDHPPTTVAALLWRLAAPLQVASTAPVGGGIGRRAWVVNVQVAEGYARRDTDAHVAEVATALRLTGQGVGMLTAAPVDRVAVAEDEGVRVEATVGLSLPVWAAAPAEKETMAGAIRPGTINVVAFLPVRHSDAALANVLCTVTEAKVQALVDAGVPGTGTASDAVTVLCPADGAAEPFGGPRARYGAPVARALYAALRTGMERPA